MTVTADEVRSIVSEVLAEQKRLHEDDLDDVVLRTLTTLLTTFGMEEQDRIEMRADLAHLRRWRKSVEQAQGLTFKVVLTAIVSGVLGALWLGLKALLGK